MVRIVGGNVVPGKILSKERRDTWDLSTSLVSFVFSCEVVGEKPVNTPAEAASLVPHASCLHTIRTEVLVQHEHIKH